MFQIILSAASRAPKKVNYISILGAGNYLIDEKTQQIIALCTVSNSMSEKYA